MTAARLAAAAYIARGRAGLDVGAGGDQRAHHRRMAGARRQEQRRIRPDPRRRLHVGAGIEEHAGHLGVAVAGRPVQRGHPVGLRGVDVAGLLQQRAHGLAIALLGRLRHCRSAGLGEPRRSAAVFISGTKAGGVGHRHGSGVQKRGQTKSPGEARGKSGGEVTADHSCVS
jgi:hypothetical protein